MVGVHFAMSQWWFFYEFAKFFKQKNIYIYASDYLSSNGWVSEVWKIIQLNSCVNI